MRPHHALAFSLVLSLAACDGSGTDVSGDASHDSSPSDGTTDGATDGTTDPVDTTPADVPVDPGLDPFADPPDAGYPPACGPDVCCTESPVDCIGAWQCVGDLCMWV